MAAHDKMMSPLMMIALGHHGDKPGAEPDEDGGGDEQLRTACQELHDSMKSGDIDGMMSAFKAAFLCCDADKDEGKDEEPEEPAE